MKNIRNNLILSGGLIGGVVGLIISFFIFSVKQGYRFKWLIQPIFDLNTLITGCYKECYYIYLVYLFIFIFISSLIGVFIGFLIKLKKSKGR